MTSKKEIIYELRRRAENCDSSIVNTLHAPILDAEKNPLDQEFKEETFKAIGIFNKCSCNQSISR